MNESEKMGNMGLTPAKLRTWILILAGCLVAAIAGFFVYGRWQGRRLGHDRPGGLETSIQQSTEGFTYSESRGGHTIYTLHASKAVQYKGSGHAELHDVSITLYGAEGQPANRIYGSDFDWDPVHGIARALGEVQIDFQGAANPGPQAGKVASDENENKNTVHVKTSGLIFNKQTGLASTPERIEFRLAQAAGSATGASFDSQTGIIILTADVAFNSSVGGDPLEVHAHHAQYDRASRQLYLLQDVTDYADNHSSSDQATVSFRTDGSAYQVLAEGHVVFTGSDGQQINARIAHVDLDAKSEPQQAILDGGLLYVANDEARLVHGSAASGTMLFGPQTTIRHAQLRTAVSVVDEEKLPQLGSAKTKQNPAQSTTRQVQASKVDIDFARGPDRSPLAQHILASGGGRVNVHTIYTKTPPEDMTIAGDELFATLVDGEVLSSVRGTGHTSLVTVTPAGVTQSSKGDNLLLTFAPPRPPEKAQGKAAKGKQTNPSQSAAQLQSAVQTGNVTLIQQGGQQAGATASGPAPAPTTATAQRAAYDAATQIVQLTGNPRIQEETGELSATSLEMDRTTGNANATGDVKATYRQAKGQQGKGPENIGFAGTGPVHVVADRAHLDHATDITTFYGKAGEQARMWQGNDSVSAPVLELSRAHGTLSAHGQGNAPAVNAVFTNSKPNTKAQAAPSVVRLQSRTLFYAENDHKAIFSGAVVAQTSSGILHSSFMDVYLNSGPSPAKASDQQGGQKPTVSSQSVSKIVARGAVQLEQPGRKGTGEELTYTASDGKFVLTGTSAAPPRLSDQVRGVVTGNALIFNDRDDSVVVSGGTSNAVTQTRVAR
ncbi:MAG TPA: LptA/OstA family protein [Acidobacteriaceae bacterium]|nr:LptA/OstA family protein [Acidobacteriaceae bacterium]